MGEGAGYELFKNKPFKIIILGTQNFSYLGEKITTAFAGSWIKLNFKDNPDWKSPYALQILTNDTVQLDSEENLTFINKGDVDVLISDQSGKSTHFKLKIEKYFYVEFTKVLISEADAWAASKNGVIPQAGDIYLDYAPGEENQWGRNFTPFIRMPGSLCSEWGDMSQWGWPTTYSGDDSEEPSLYVTATKDAPSPGLVRTAAVANNYSYNYYPTNPNPFNVCCILN